MIEAFPDVVVPGHESVVILTKHSPRLKLHEENSKPDIDDKTKPEPETSEYEQLNLVASLNIFTTDNKGNKTIIHKKTWQINENNLRDDKRTYSFYMENGKRPGKGRTHRKFSKFFIQTIAHFTEK